MKFKIRNLCFNTTTKQLISEANKMTTQLAYEILFDITDGKEFAHVVFIRNGFHFLIDFEVEGNKDTFDKLLDGRLVCFHIVGADASNMMCIIHDKSRDIMMFHVTVKGMMMINEIPIADCTNAFTSVSKCIQERLDELKIEEKNKVLARIVAATRGRVYNPASGRYVNHDGRVGKKILDSKIFVTVVHWSGDEYTFRVKTSNTIQDIGESIDESFGEGYQRICLEGKELNRHRTLAEYGIEDGTTFEMTRKLYFHFDN